MSRRACAVEGCDRRYRCSGYCEIHYDRLRRHGDPLFVVDRSRGACKVHGCDSPHWAKGYCNTHYAQTWRDGNRKAPVLRTPRPRRQKISMFDRISENPEIGCWDWHGYLDRDGYGRVTFEGAFLLAHRVFYVEFTGADIEGLVLDHLCRIRACVNPWHLDPVTASVNSSRRFTEPLPVEVLREMAGLVA